MKYEYQDLIENTLVKEFGEIISKNSLKDAEIVIAKSYDGICNFYQCTENYSPHITVNHGSLLYVKDRKGDELPIYFTVYIVSVGPGNKVHYLCHIDID